MSYRLPLDEPARTAVRDVARERATHALRTLRKTAPHDPATAVHDVRKDAKKLRALLRLLQPGIDRDLRRDENAAVAQIARGLSGSRDAEVLAGLADDLRIHAAGQAPEPTFAAIHDAFAARVGGSDDVEAPIATAVTGLEALRDRIAQWPLGEVDNGTLIAGLTRSYTRGREELARVRKHPDDPEQRHEWRKRVKDLWYQERLLRDSWPGVLKAQAEALADLGELLGDEHDLSVLRDQLTAPDGVGATLAVDLAPVVAAIDRRRAQLQRDALALGARVYAEKPAAFERRHRAYLKTARAQTRAAGAFAPAA
jgi:CHAD domain-containing protein